MEDGWNTTTKSGKQSKKKEWEEDLVSAYNALVRDMGLKNMDRCHTISDPVHHSELSVLAREYKDPNGRVLTGPCGVSVLGSPLSPSSA